MERYRIERSATTDKWVLTDTQNMIVVTWEDGRFNATQKITFLEDVEPNPLAIARLMREIGDYLAEHHRSKVEKVSFGRLCHAYGTSVAEVASKLGITPQALQNRVKNKRSLNKLREVADAVGCQLEELL